MGLDIKTLAAAKKSQKKSSENISKIIIEESDRAKSEEQKISENLNDEIKRAKTTENKLSDDIKREIDRATTAENLRAPSESPNLTGVPTVPDAVKGTNTAQIANTKFVHTELDSHNTSSFSHEDIRNLIKTIKNRLDNLLDSDDTTLDQLSEIVSYIKNNKSLIDNITTNKINVSDIIDNLTSSDVNKPLSSKQGKILKDLITELSSSINEKLPNNTKYAASDSVGGAANSLKYFKSTSVLALDLSSTDSNAIGYCKGNTPISNPGSDGALYGQVYSNLWAHQIFGDYRTGQLAIRGKNNGDWQAWRKVLDSTNFKDYVTKSAIGLGNIDNTADTDKNVSSAKTLDVQPDNWKQGTDLPSTYPRGATIFFSNNPANKFNGISYCTIHTIKGYTNMACIQFLYPYNSVHDKCYFREALYNTDAWRPWYEVITSKNIGSQSVNYAESAGSATKAAQDTNGNNIPNTYARRSIYGDNAISLGRKTGTTVGAKSFAMGYDVTASGNYSHAEGLTSTASGNYSHAEGSGISNGSASHAEGYGATAGGHYSHAEGNGTRASGNASHAEGRDTTASGDHSHAGGYGTIAENFASYAFGRHNRSMTTGGSMSAIAGDVLVIGNGSYSARSNAFRVTYGGNVFGIGAFQSSGADYAEFVKPWWDGNFYNEDRVGYFVTVKDGMLHKAEPSDYIYGITSGNPSVVGNADEDYYWRYERDEFNRIMMEDVPELVQTKDEEGNPIFDEETHEPLMVETGSIIKNARMKLADDYDPSLQESYVPRAKRPEWDYVGMIGVLPIRDDGTCIPGRFCKCGKGGIATLAEKRGFDTFHVIERISDNVVSVLLK